MNELEKYIELPYSTWLQRDSDGDFVARIEELPGCSAHGKTREEALANLDEAKKLWIEDCLEHGDPVPVPVEQEALPSGKWLQRVPRKLHRKLQQLAKQDGVSFNQFVSVILAEAVGVQKRAVQAEGVSTQVSAYDLLHGSLQKAFDVAPLTTWQVVDVSQCAGTFKGYTNVTEALSLLSAQLPNKFEFKGKEPKHATKRKHPGLEIW
jgi:antitoxin HicB